jgi:DNA-binding transcriptional LysR family regulator
MELRQLRYFVTVAEEGGFGLAAERLHIVQPAVSQQIQRLERELGLQLFDRSTRNIRITAAGERLLPEARAVLAAASRVDAVAAQIANGAEGLVRLGTGPAADARLYATLDQLAAAPPRLRVRIIKMAPAERLAAVRSGELDAAIVKSMTSAGGLELLPLWSDPLFAALPAEHPLAAHPTLRLRQLADLPLRLAPHESNPQFHDLVTAAFREAGIEPALGPPFTHLQDTLADIAGAPTPSWTILYPVGDFPATRTIAFRPLEGPRIDTSLAVPPGPPTPALRHLLNALNATIGNDGRGTTAAERQ